jgi:Rpb7p/Rpc25p/MJ0397 family SHS2 domain-containing protein
MFILVRRPTPRYPPKIKADVLAPQTKIADLVQIAPDDFRKRSVVAIEDNINAKYANKVIQKIGLCIGLYDLLWTSEGLIGHGTGLVNVNGSSSGQRNPRKLS